MKDGVLKITADDTRNRAFNISLGVSTVAWPSVTVYLAGTEYEDIKIVTGSGDVDVENLNSVVSAILNVYYFPYQKRLEVYPLHVASSNNIYGDTSRETINSFFKMYGSSETAFYARVSEVFETALIENWRTGNPTTLFQDTLGEFETVYKEVEN